MEYKNTISLILIGKDYNKDIFNRTYVLLKDNKLPSAELLYGQSESIESKVKLFVSECLKYNSDFLKTNLLDVEVVNKDGVICDMLYSCVFGLMPKLNKIGTFYSISEIEEREILLDERTRRYIYRESSRIT